MANEFLLLVEWACRYETGCGTCVQLVEFTALSASGRERKKEKHHGQIGQEKRGEGGWKETEAGRYLCFSYEREILISTNAIIIAKSIR